MSDWSYSDLLKLVEIKDKNIDHYLERITELESELERTRKALDVAKDTLQRIQFRGSHSKFWVGKDDGTIALKALEQITALEQKGVK